MAQRVRDVLPLILTALVVVMFTAGAVGVGLCGGGRWIWTP